MRSYLLGAAALSVLASPAVARDNSWHFGLEVGALKVLDSDVEIDGDDIFEIDHKTGVDGDMIAGYDFGAFRLEGELGYKRSEHDNYAIDGDEVDGDGRTSVYSGMLNAMVEGGQNNVFDVYGGGGIGIAQVTHVLDSDNEGFKIQDRGLAWQLFAGVRKSVSQYFEIGLKYRYFDAGDSSDTIDGDKVRADYRSHSLLIGLIHSWAPAPRAVVAAPMVLPPPPAPMAPATQTCPDGSVILATDACPLPPPPPPPPPPVPERG